MGGNAKKRLRHAPEERLRWRVLKAFGVLPGEERARHMTRREYLYCVLQQWLDEEEKLESLCPACRARAAQRRCSCCGAPLASGEAAENTAFDARRYRRMKEGKDLCTTGAICSDEV